MPFLTNLFCRYLSFQISVRNGFVFKMSLCVSVFRGHRSNLVLLINFRDIKESVRWRDLFVVFKMGVFQNFCAKKTLKHYQRIDEKCN